ncbi:MAG: glycosyltransferase family 4 protein [Candidatus Curtissbacteria bacterium]|nr:glycosyltransferase family 4 protein [Candidatus Curtissbacteria bacterium]
MIILSPQLGLSQKSILGGEVFDREILLGLAKNGIKIEIILPKGKPHDENIKNWHVTCLPISHFPAQFFNFLIIPQLLKLRNKNIQIIRLHQPQFMFIAAILFKFFSPNVKTLATYHKFEETNFGFLSKAVNNFWDHIICDSDTVKIKIEDKFQVDPGKITVVHNGVPSYLKPGSKDKSLERKLKLEGKIVLLFMGLFIERKNPLFIIDALAKLSETNSNVVLVFWGEGPLKEKIVKRAGELNIAEKIRFIAPVFGPKKNKIHNLADIFVHPSLDEGFALAPLEAMVCAKPVVMTDGYSAREAVINGYNGYLCRPNDIKDWVNKLSRLISDKNLRAKMGKNSYSKAKKEFSWNQAVEKHVEVLRSLNEH